MHVTNLKNAWFSCMVTLLLTAAAAPTAAQISHTQVTGGRIAGTTVDGVSEFKGVPFAAPPVGELRWKAPRPVKPWAGVRQTVAFGPACMQNADQLKRQAPGISAS
jgi:para-nitrobenzyl esterase